MAKLAPAGTDIETAARAADRAARFALTEGWATGPLWIAYGAQFVLSRWAVEHGHNLEELRAALGRQGDDNGSSQDLDESG